MRRQQGPGARTGAGLPAARRPYQRACAPSLPLLSLPSAPARSYFGAVADADNFTAIAVGSLFEHKVSCGSARGGTTLARSQLGGSGSALLSCHRQRALAVHHRSLNIHLVFPPTLQLEQEVVEWTVNVTDVAPGPVTVAIVDGNPPNVQPGETRWAVSSAWPSGHIRGDTGSWS